MCGIRSPGINTLRGKVNLEITESMIMDNAVHTRQVLQELRAMGVGLHMDDFGTGYSSLHCLHVMPLNCLKIDRSFITTMVGAGIMRR